MITIQQIQAKDINLGLRPEDFEEAVAISFAKRRRIAKN
jgi:hypothetical protein